MTHAGWEGAQGADPHVLCLPAQCTAYSPRPQGSQVSGLGSSDSELVQRPSGGGSGWRPH
jgi:hypothetical protein